MDQMQPTIWTIERQALWSRISSHNFDRHQPLSFVARLARDHGWPMEFARAAVAEYAKFCFLAMVSAAPVTPSEEVDQVWHLHLIYTRDYWEIWCGSVLQAPLHHHPTQGGPAEDQRYRLQYAATLATYETFFGLPPEPFWPATHRRFRRRPRFRTLDADRWLALPRPSALRLAGDAA